MPNTLTREKFHEIFNACKKELTKNDVHKAVAAYLFDVDYTAVTPEQRQYAKNADYVHLYSYSAWPFPAQRAAS